MFKSNAIKGLTIASLFAVLPAYAITLGDPIQEPAVITLPYAKGQVKNVTLMNFILTAKEREAMLNRPFHPVASSKMRWPVAEVDLGMNEVPVLDQGQHGTCVTFANTAAIDAAVFKRDYVSQLCNLELGNYLEKTGYTYNGWNGSWGPVVLNQIMRFGIVSKAHQLAGLCGEKDYPVHNKADEGSELNPLDYKNSSEDLNGLVNWSHILSDDSLTDEKPSPSVADEIDAVFAKSKQALIAGHRLTFGTALIIAEGCKVGACAKFHATNDTWALTDELNHPTRIGGHEMVIIGFNDNAIAYDNAGKPHQGLFKLRNSWNVDVGDHGDFYMSYDYFKKYVHEVQEIIPLKS